METNEFDAIVVGTGVSGGWAAKELCEKGLKTLVLGVEDGEAYESYPTMPKKKDPWDFPAGDTIMQKLHVSVNPSNHEPIIPPPNRPNISLWMM